MDININGTTTAINEVNFDGNSDIQKVNVDGVDVWFKAPTAQEVAQALADDAPSSSGGMNKDYRQDTSFLRYHGQQQDNESTLSLSDGISISGLSAPITTSPYVTLIGITDGTDQNGGSLGSQFYTPTGGSETGATENAAVTYTGWYKWLTVRTSYVNKSLADLSNYRVTYQGAADDRPILRTQLVLPNKWNASTVSSTWGSTTLAAGEILIVHIGSSFCDGYVANHYAGNIVTPGNNSAILENQAYWYYPNSIGIYANTTSSSQSISWAEPALTYCGGDVVSANVRVMKLTQQGI